MIRWTPWTTLLLASCETNLAARYLATTSAPLCDATVPARAETIAPFEVSTFSVDLPGPEGQEVLDVLRCCVPSRVVAPLASGSYALAIRGGAGDLCDLLVEAEIEGAYTAYECHVERPDLWGGWTEGTTPPTAALREHCEIVAERAPG